MSVSALIADDHPLFRQALKLALQGIVDGELRETDSLSGTLEALQREPEIDLVFLDLNMPGSHSLEGLSQVLRSFPDTSIAVISALESSDIVERALALGACGYIPKSTPLEVIVEAVSALLDGNVWIPTELKTAEQGEKGDVDINQVAKRISELTPHQYKVLSLIADGLLNKQIAYELNVRETTIKQHVSAILRKLGVYNRTQAGIMFKSLMATEQT